MLHLVAVNTEKTLKNCGLVEYFYIVRAKGWIIFWLEIRHLKTHILLHLKLCCLRFNRYLVNTNKVLLVHFRNIMDFRL